MCMRKQELVEWHGEDRGQPPTHIQAMHFWPKAAKLVLAMFKDLLGELLKLAILDCASRSLTQHANLHQSTKDKAAKEVGRHSSSMIY
eukprot:381487-Amphidinium_carterae.2